MSVRISLILAIVVASLATAAGASALGGGLKVLDQTMTTNN